MALVPDLDDPRSLIRLYSVDSDQPEEMRVSGRVRDLLFAPDQGSVFGLLHKPARKREGDTTLIRIDLQGFKLRRLFLINLQNKTQCLQVKRGFQ